MQIRRMLLAPLAIAAALANIARVDAQSYPARPVTMIVPFAAGGGADAVPRSLAERMRASFGQPVIIENIGGAGGTIATGRVARAAPDGYTLGIGTYQTHVLNGATYTLPYDVQLDFEPIALIASAPNLIVVSKSVPAKDMKDLSAWLKANHGKVSQAHIGIGGGQHLCGLDLQNKIGVRWQFVPYRGSALALQDVVGGQIDLMCITYGSSVSVLRSGLVKPIAFASSTRLASAPDIPTVDEAGLRGLYHSTWYGLWAPRATPKDVIAKLNSALVEALADPNVRARVDAVGLEVQPHDQQTPKALRALQKADIEKWWPVIKAENIKAE